MSKGWISLHRGDLVESLMEHNPNAFLLLTQIAMRARRDDCPITGLKTGEAFIGDFKKAGIPTQMKYRTAKKQLESIELVTFKTTNKGTIATLLDTRVYSTNKIDRNDQKNIKTTSQQRADNDQITTKKNVRKKEGKKEDIALPHGVGFNEAWIEWNQFLLQKKKKPTPLTITRQLKTLSALSEPEAVNCINNSIMNGWQGLFPDDLPTSKQSINPSINKKGKSQYA